MAAPQSPARAALWYKILAAAESGPELSRFPCSGKPRSIFFVSFFPVTVSISHFYFSDKLKTKGRSIGQNSWIPTGGLGSRMWEGQVSRYSHESYMEYWGCGDDSPKKTGDLTRNLSGRYCENAGGGSMLSEGTW